MSHKICRLLFKIGAECLKFKAFIFINSMDGIQMTKFPSIFQKLVCVFQFVRYKFWLNAIIFAIFIAPTARTYLCALIHLMN